MNIVATIKNTLEFTAFDGSIVTLKGQFLVSRCSDGSPRFVGDIELSDHNRETLETLNHGSRPSIEFDDKGNEREPELPVDPLRDLPLWKYVKPSKKLGTTGQVVPIQSVYNRPTDAGQVGDIRGDMVRNGFDTKRRTISLSTSHEGVTHVVDGGHSITAISQLDQHDWNDEDSPLNSSNVVSIQVIEGIGGISGFDEGLRARQVKDMLSALALSPGWESDVQVVLSSLCLLCSGKSVKGSGKSLPHLVKDDGKPRRLHESEVAKLFTESIPGFERIRDALNELNRYTIRTMVDVDEAIWADTPLVEYPTINRYSLPAWILAIIECSYVAGYDIATIVATIHERIINDSDPVTSKVNAWASVKGKGSLDYQYPILCSAILAYMGSDLPTRKPTDRKTCLVKIAYDAWMDNQAK
jgi:hypothetical protein